MVIGVSFLPPFSLRHVFVTDRVRSPVQLPPVMNFGSDALKKEIIPEVLAGRKWICLAITEVSNFYSS